MNRLLLVISLLLFQYSLVAQTYGCTDPSASNYDDSATEDDGSCCFINVEIEVLSPVCAGGVGFILVHPIYLFPDSNLVVEVEGSIYFWNEMYFVMPGSYIVNLSLYDDEFIELGCSTSIEVVVPDTEPLVIDVTVTDASILGNGIGTLNITGGTPPYTVFWTNTTSQIVDPNSLTEGEYIVWVMDDNYCDTTISVSVIWNSVYDIISSPDINVYPNPSSNYLTVELGDLSGINTTIRLYDLSGNLIFERLSSSNLTIDVSNYARGVYYVELSTHNDVIRRKVVVY